MSLDLLITNGEIIDGLGVQRYRANVGIKGDSINYIGTNEPEASEIIDASGLVVTPGFIDIHTHEDIWLLHDPSGVEKLCQGVTTLIVGNCGFSAAPLLPGKEKLVQDESILNFANVTCEWHTMDEYLLRLESVHPGVNVGTLVGHNVIRLNVIGLENRCPSENEFEKMEELIHDAMIDGALGLSTGLIYVPGIYSETNELIRLSKIVAKDDGVYVSHIRGEGSALESAVQEALRIGLEAKVPVQISHHKASGRDNWGKVQKTLRAIEVARADGLDVAFDVYPYNAGNTGLVTLIPSWVFSNGPTSAEDRMTDPRTRMKIVSEMLTKDAHEERPLVDTGSENIIISYCKSNPTLEGKSLATIANENHSNPAVAVLDLIQKYGRSILVILFEMSEQDVENVVRHPLSMIASDSVNPTGKPHPRVYGTSSRILAKFVREKHQLTLEDAIRKMSSMPASRMGLRDRGVIKTGYKADIVVFDPAAVQDRATFTESNQLAEGMSYVFVNGKKALENTKVTPERAGKVLRHQLREDSI